MIKYVVLALLLYSQVSLSQTREDSLNSRVNGFSPPEIGSPGKLVQDNFKQEESRLIGEEPHNLVPGPPALGGIKISYLRPLVSPAILLGFGFLSLGNPEFLESNEGFQRVLSGQFADFHSGLDNYTRYVPLAAVYGLNLSGIKGRNNVFHLSLIFALSGLINNTLTQQIKGLTRERRPDALSFDAFPSRHTSTAFANAEIMHKEFKDKSACYSIAGYSLAVATGSMRMLNNRHWLSDVVAGAGVGILSTRLAYVIYPWLQKKINLTRLVKGNMLVTPMYQQGSYGLNMALLVGN